MAENGDDRHQTIDDEQNQQKHQHQQRTQLKLLHQHIPSSDSESELVFEEGSAEVSISFLINCYWFKEKQQQKNHPNLRNFNNDEFLEIEITLRMIFLEKKKVIEGEIQTLKFNLHFSIIFSKRSHH